MRVKRSLPVKQRPRVEKSLTLIASLKCSDGIVIASDTEEVIAEPPLLRTHREKLRVLANSGLHDWLVVLGGSGEYDYIGMIGDLIDEKLSRGSSNANQGDIDNTIRSAVAEVWRDYARHEQRTIDVKLLIVSRACQQTFPRLTVVSGAAVRRGADVEAIGIGDATFKALADRFIQHGVLSTVSANAESARIFMVYAMLQAKLSIPGIGGNTRIITVENDNLRYMKSWAVGAIQTFFGNIDARIRNGISGLEFDSNPSADPVEGLIGNISDAILKEYRKLKEELREIDGNDSLV